MFLLHVFYFSILFNLYLNLYRLITYRSLFFSFKKKKKQQQTFFVFFFFFFYILTRKFLKLVGPVDYA